MKARWFALVPWLAAAGFCLSARQDPETKATSEATDPFAAAVADYDAGRYRESLTGWQALAAELGPQAPPEVLGNLALAALRGVRLGDAEAAARKLEESASSAERAYAAFLLAHAAYLRSQQAEAAARLPDAEPRAWDAALSSCHAAAAAWMRADTLAAAGWPAAVRNAERAVRRLSELERLRDEAERQKPPAKKEPDQPEQKPQRKPDEKPEEQDPEMMRTKMSPEEVAKLLLRLEQKDREKRMARTAQQRAGATAGERDW
jgi:hypothetical protein